MADHFKLPAHIGAVYDNVGAGVGIGAIDRDIHPPLNIIQANVVGMLFRHIKINLVAGAGIAYGHKIIGAQAGAIVAPYTRAGNVGTAQVIMSHLKLLVITKNIYLEDTFSVLHKLADCAGIAKRDLRYRIYGDAGIDRIIGVGVGTTAAGNKGKGRDHAGRR